MDFDRWLADLQARVADTQRKSAELVENLGNTTAKETSPDGAVTVVVGANGALHSIELSPRVAEHTPAQLSALIMKTVHKAQRTVAGKVSEELQPFDASGEMLERYVSYQPPVDPEEEAAEVTDSSSINTEFGMRDMAEAAPQAAAPPAPPAPPAAPQFAPPQPVAASRPRPRPATEDDDESEDRPW